jgi:ERCC4-type nuclease
VPYTTAALDVGDLLIQTVDGDPLLVAERKSHADFVASNAQASSFSQETLKNCGCSWSVYLQK